MSLVKPRPVTGDPTGSSPAVWNDEGCPGSGLLREVHQAVQDDKSGVREGEGIGQNTSDSFGAQVPAIRVTGVDAQPLHTVLLPDTRTVVIPTHEAWMDSCPKYARNETIKQRMAGTH